MKSAFEDQRLAISRWFCAREVLLNRSSLGFRLALWSLWVVSGTALLFGAVAWQIVSARINHQAAQDAESQASTTLRTLATIDQLTRAQVDAGMQLLEAEGNRKGTPSLKGAADLGGHSVPNLCLGGESQVQNYDVVDRVKALVGGTATLFAWNGADFVRVTTNVMKPDGSRAIGTVLDSKGRAYGALRQGQAFNGVVDILGVPYTTSYVPMKDASGAIVGAWYTGYRLDSIAGLGKSIADSRILAHGFVALSKPNGAVVFHSSNVSDNDLQQAIAHPKGWNIKLQTYPGWGYTVLTAYPASDVWKQLLKAFSLVALGILVLVAAIVTVQSALLRHLVLHPINHLSQQMLNANLNSQMESGRADEIGTLADAFNQFVSRLRQTLLQVRDGSLASTAKSTEIRSVSAETVTRMSEQLRCAEEASASMVELSEHIASTASHTGEAMERARAAADAARQGGELVASTSEMIQSLASNTQQSAAQVASLNERVQQIGSIVGVIEEIASGTNLLALNASIEAARAGAQGRGFAVVAGEVRRLAERTAQATQQVATLVSGIEQETNNAAQGILAACTHAQQGSEAVAGLDRQFGQISHLVIEVDGRIERIAEAAREEAQAANAVSSSMRVVASSAQQSASGAERVVGASGELLHIAEQLELMVGEFQVQSHA